MGGLEIVKKRKIAMALCIMMAVAGMTGCSNNVTEIETSNFSAISSVCKLATLKCYYHNVARDENQSKGRFNFLQTGYKKVWVEYEGIVDVGVDVNKVKIETPDTNGVVKVVIPDAEILSIDLDENSISEPLTDHGFLTWITMDEKTSALAAAQENMKESAVANQALLNQAKERAKDIIEDYIKNVGQEMGKDYTVQWIEYEETENQ